MVVSTTRNCDFNCKQTTLRRHSIPYIIYARALALLALASAWGCSSSDGFEVAPGTDYVMVDLAFSVAPDGASSAATRMAADTVQSTTTRFRGIQGIHLIPFDKAAADEPIADDDTPYEMDSLYTTFERAATSVSNYLSNSPVPLHIGMSSFLCYARANADNATAKRIDNGLIDTTFPNSGLTPADIAFQLHPITDDYTDDGGKAQKLADYLTNIANAEKWVATTNPTLKKLRERFIDGLVAGSSANVRAIVSQLWTEMKEGYNIEDTDPVLMAILDSIQQEGVVVNGTEVTSLGEEMDDYPENVHLPAGAAAMIWENDDNRFVPHTNADGNQDMNDPSRFTYPAELYYYANSRIMTSDESQRAHYTEPQWYKVCQNYKGSDVVTAQTKSVAIRDSLDYAVCCLVLTIQADATRLFDSDDEAVNLTSTSFPLKGVFVSGQFPQRFDFTPTDEADAPESIIYDEKPVAGIYLTTTKSQPTYTLVLQTKVDKPIDIVLEFENNCGKEFAGASGGRVWPGTRFYLAGVVTPEMLRPADAQDYEQRVFTKDHKTTLNMNIGSLRSAYNVIPALKTAEHELRPTSVAISKWREGTEQSNKVYNW